MSENSFSAPPCENMRKSRNDILFFRFSLSRPSFFFFFLNNKVGTTDFFTPTLPFKWFIRFPTGFRRRVDLFWLFTATVPGAFTEISEVINHPSVPGCLVCLIFSNYCFVIRKNFYYLAITTYYLLPIMGLYHWYLLRASSFVVL